MSRLRRILLILVSVSATVLAFVSGYAWWHLHGKLPQRAGTLALRGLSEPVTVRYDERGVPHITARNEADLYRALGYVHAQDRLFQMEIMRRLARGELSEVLGNKTLDTDRLFRTLELRANAEKQVTRMDHGSATWRALQAYLDGINEFQDTRPLPVEFELLGIHPVPYTAVDALAVAGYVSYSFAAALRTEPVLTYVRDQLGPNYLQVFDLEWQPLGVVGPMAQAPSPARPRVATDWKALARIAEASQRALEIAGVPQFEGSNAWVISGRRTASGRPLLAGDPHIAFSVPAVWYEAHLQAPGFELYGHLQALDPFPLLGFNASFGWSLTMFQNDDMDLVALRTDPAHPNQVWQRDHWAAMTRRNEQILVKNADPVTIILRHTPYGPIINEAFSDTLGPQPVALWWTFLEADNPVLEAFYALGRADTRDKARAAASQIAAPGLNIVWANAQGDIAWWAAAKLVQRPPGVNSYFILDAASGQAEKPGYYRFEDNPQEENPARGYIVSANHQPVPRSGVPVPGYYNLPDRARRLDALLSSRADGWTAGQCETLQLDVSTGYASRLLRPLMPSLRQQAGDGLSRLLVDQLAEWDGQFDVSSIGATVFTQFTYELAQAAMADELGPMFASLPRTRLLDAALARLAADPDSPWWDDRNTPARETRDDIVRKAWQATIEHLRKERGDSPAEWSWGRVHTLTHVHPLGRVAPLDRIFNVGPFPAPGGRELPNNLAQLAGPSPWAVMYGPSTRRVIDFASPDQAVGINPVGQSGVLLDEHYADQAADYIAGRYERMHLEPGDVQRNTRSTLTLEPES